MLLGACVECGDPATEEAHVIPRSRGGKSTVPMCGPCHGLMHEMGREQDIRTLTREGLARARAAGVRLGRPSVLPADVVARIVRERAAGNGLRVIAEALTAEGIATARGRATWSTSSVQAVLAGQDAAKLSAQVTS